MTSTLKASRSAASSTAPLALQRSASLAHPQIELGYVPAAPANDVGGDVAQLDLFAVRQHPESILDRELWRRRQDRREACLAGDLGNKDAMLLPLVLALARLAAQRDARGLARSLSQPSA
jgi:hypothetical protein